jgi:hypothetical protein
MFICNPFEGTTTLNDPSTRGRQIKMQLHGGQNSQFFPGNYGWLDTPVFKNGAVGLKDALASVAPPVCFAQDGVEVQTGNIDPADDALNVRFDIWRGSLKSQMSNPNYRPAENVRKGYGGTCNNPNDDPDGNGDPLTADVDEDPLTDPTSAPGRFPRDKQFSAAQGRLGSGDWDFETYWAATFGESEPLPNGWSDTSENNRPPSRYRVYRHEVSTMGSGTLSDLVNRTGPYGEVGGPQCYKSGGLSDKPDRRIIYAAILNCSELNVSGSSGGPLPVHAFGKFFLTEPVPPNGSADQGTIYSEFVDVLTPGDGNNVVRDVVQLYR